MRYRFIRTGDKPVDEGANEFEIRECFAYCTPKVKSRLDKFLMTDKEEQEKVRQAILKAIPKRIKPRNIVLALYPILTQFSKEFVRKVEKDEF